MCFYRNKFTLSCIALLVVFGLSSLTTAQELIDNTIRPVKNIVVPDQFLRRWDPVTIFFSSGLGRSGQAESNPQQYVRLSPDHPGAYTWLDDRTLQFRPSEPWPPLSQFQWQVGNRTATLSTLISAPIHTNPAINDSDLQPVDSISLTFPAPISPLALKKMVTIELRALPGVHAPNSNDQSAWLDEKDFEIKTVERKNRNDKATYIITLFNPIVENTKAIVHLRLSLDDQLAKSDQSFFHIPFSTAQAFTVQQLGCANQLYPISPAGSHYPQQQAIQCSGGNQQIQIHFSSRLSELNPISARNLVHISPGVEDIDYQSYGNVLTLTGNFQNDQLYQINLEPTDILDHNNRKLSVGDGSQLFLFFPQQNSFLHTQIGEAIIERYGPQMLPLSGRGHERLDLRIHPIDPLDRSFWPFSETPLTIDEESRPEAPGEKPSAFTDFKRYISIAELRRQIKALGAPTVSTLIDIPLKQTGPSASFGLDLRSPLEKVVGKEKPGTYLIGIRKLDSSRERSWIRLQVTDLSLSTIHEPQRVRFVVSSLRSGEPVSNAEISVEGRDGNIVVAHTNSQGQFDWRVVDNNRDTVQRIVVRKNDDILVLNPSRPPDRYSNNLWQNDRRTWLQWTQSRLYQYDSSGENLCHLFTERPVYKPEETVHIKGYFRHHQQGRFSVTRPNTPRIVIDGPGDLEWIYPVEISSSGSYYTAFTEENLPTGQYNVTLHFAEGRCGSVSFNKEAYRLPKFEVQLNGPTRADNDQPFLISMNAQYYAGGPVSGQAIDWQVTQFPYSYTPKKIPGFFYSSDARFSQSSSFESTAAITQRSITDSTGAASITIDPTIEVSAQARRYIVEATVTGSDDQTVTSTFQTLALPPFVLGLNVPRYLQDNDVIPAKILVADSLGELIANQTVSIKMLHRQWHSHLQLGDYSQGEAKYITEVVDVLVYENNIESKNELTELNIPITEAGVYIVEIEARDKLGRSQSVQVDLFAGGDEPVTWSQPASQVFKITPSKEKYAPGETATLILESPFQNAKALAIVEQPNGINRYQWVNISGGKAEYKVEVQQSDLPRLPVHFLLMRGRVIDQLLGNLDLGKPQTLAASTFIEVSSVNNRVTMELNYPEKVQPGDEITIDIALSDHQGKPLSGEVTLWLVDQSVLALGKEQEIDLLPDFIRHRNSYTSLRDTRNLALGFFPYQEQPGGGDSQQTRLASELLDNVTVRKNFSPVPYFNPNILVDENGKQQVTLTLPDNLTNFKVRAKVVSGADKFGFYKGDIAIRLPVIVQPSLPRFVRPGDSFSAIAIGRVVEGDGGEGRAEISVEGLDIGANQGLDFLWRAESPHRIEFPVQVPNPEYSSDGILQRNSVSVTIAVQRNSDQARDAFKVDIPIRPDRKAVQKQTLHTLAPGESVNIEAIDVPLRPGGFRQSILLSDQTALLSMSAGLNYLLDYPHGCTEQRLSRARAQLASQKFSNLLTVKVSEKDSVRNKVINDTFNWIDQVINDNGLVSYWPGSDSYVSLTAWTLLFFTEAQQAGYSVNQTQWDQLINALRLSLRSDYTGFITGESYAERSWALLALTMAGENTSAYSSELARRSDYLNLESLSQVIVALSKNDSAANEQLNALYDRMWSQIVFRLFQGREIYGGLQQSATAANALILPSETRAIAQVLRATSVAPTGIKQNLPENRRQNLIDALVNLGKGDGWGSTNANAAALLSLSEVLNSEADNTIPFSMILDNKVQEKILNEHLFTQTKIDNVAITVSNPSDNTVSLSLLNDTRYLPAQPGSEISALANRFVINRELLEVLDNDQPPRRIPLQQVGSELVFSVGTIIEEHIELIVPNDSHHVAVVVPLAAGMEALNPSLATSPPEALPNGQTTMNASYTAFYDDQMAFYFDSLPRGTYHFYFRTRATIPGEFIQPPAFAELMYNESTNGNSYGARVVINKVLQ